MHRLSERLTALEERSGKRADEEWQRLCKENGLTRERVRDILDAAERELTARGCGPDDPDLRVIRDALAKMEAEDATC